MLQLWFGVKPHSEEEPMDADEKGYFTAVVLYLSWL
jgi:hypothetical protein